MAFGGLEEILELCGREELPFWRAVLRDDMNERNVTEEESVRQMEELWDAMLLAASLYDKKLKSHSGLVGQDGGRMEEYLEKGEPLCGPFVGKVIAGALQMGESNACMKRIVAAPTAGACGVLPAILVPYFMENRASAEQIIEALYVAAGIGQVIAVRACIAGASGGCQAEIGTASAMAAGACVHLKGGTPWQIAQASAMAMKDLLGLVCDPVAGLVEVPCVKRNVVGAVNALAAADMALAGIESRIPPDQVFDAMKEIGDRMARELKETGEGGLAGSPAGKEIAAKVLEENA